MAKHLLSGTEAVTLELTGTMPTPRARRMVPPSLQLEEVGARTVVSLLLFDMRSLRFGGLPPGFDYGEALWRIGVLHGSEKAWFAVACDLDNPFVAFVGARLVKYPVRESAVAFVSSEADVSTKIEARAGRLNVHATLGEAAPDAVAPRRLLVAPATKPYEIPWAEDPAPFRREAAVHLVDIGLSDVTFGTNVEWSPTGLIHRGRVHRCGFALPLKPL